MVPAVVKEVVFDQEAIAKRIGELAAEISHSYRDLRPVLVVILKGAFVFACDLIRQMKVELTLDFIAKSPYLASRGGEVKIIKDLEQDISGRHVLLLEDIVDTGLTLNYLVRVLSSREPASLAICSLLDRPALRLADIPLRYVGFNVTDEFLIGYGLDYRDRYRNLPYIATMKIEGA
ncbi:MAG: hypoxanthine phosphoribosyltransferase [Acidobacteria bacterium]|nr:hypoxanthine phosphoribosyltransferase [Acidobacteriota bacterium]